MFDGLPVSYDDWRTASPDEAQVVGKCPYCKGEIFECDRVYRVDSDLVHEECFEEYAADALGAVEMIACEAFERDEEGDDY